MFSVNKNITPQIQRIGEQLTPVIIIDDYICEFESLRQQAVLKGSFSADLTTQYPGVRSALPKAITLSYLKPIMQALYQVYGIDPQLKPAPKDNYFSLITRQPQQLSAIQTLPHYDTYQSNLIALIHYASLGTHGGTGFFKHKQTGFEYISPSRLSSYQTEVDKATELFDAKEGTNAVDQLPSYCSRQHTDFDCYFEVDFKPNRLLVFPGQLLHSSLIDVATDIDSNPVTGRLTANMFVQFN